MRIAYIAPYFGPAVLKQRAIQSASTSNRIKIELVCQLLRADSHEVDLISPGEVVEPRLKFYKGFREPEPFSPEVPVFYASSLPVRRLSGRWSSSSTVGIVKRLHRAAPYDVVILFNMRSPQVAVGNYAIRHLKLPVILEYEDDAFVDVTGVPHKGLMAGYYRSHYRGILNGVSACMGVSEHLLSQAPAGIPKFLFRGLIGEDIADAGKRSLSERQNRVLFSGSHVPSNGIAQLIEAWSLANIPDWELHITGHGRLTEQLRRMAENKPGIVFHGLVDRPELVRLMSSAKIGINPHAVSQTPGNVFAFKIIEYLGAGVHVITTPMGGVESDLEPGITFMPDNHPATIAKTLAAVISRCSYEKTAASAAIAKYGPMAIRESLNTLLKGAVNPTNRRNGHL
jgi:glycosyltransferase involved in cell wall biosynthesis